MVRRYGSAAIGWRTRRWVGCACSCGKFFGWLEVKPSGEPYPAGAVLMGVFRQLHSEHGTVREVSA